MQVNTQVPGIRIIVDKYNPPAPMPTNTSYSIGTWKNECFGHGDFRDVLAVRPAYYGALPPVFALRMFAVDWLRENRDRFPTGIVIPIPTT